MKIIVFCGPTLDRNKLLAQLPHADVRPPAAQGDIYDATLDEPDVIALIDGYFESVPAVWHKEILWALHCGCRVFGASSIGALRAAELLPFGMVGVGAVFEAYRDGVLADDDEVAVTHGPPELGYLSLSEAMVNMRATLAQIRDSGRITPLRHDHIISLLKSWYFPFRSYEGLCKRFPKLASIIQEAEKIDLKRQDAERLLRTLTELEAAARAAPSFMFEHTYHWEELIRGVHRRRELKAGLSH